MAEGTHVTHAAEPIDADAPLLHGMQTEAPDGAKWLREHNRQSDGCDALKKEKNEPGGQGMLRGVASGQ